MSAARALLAAQAVRDALQHLRREDSPVKRAVLMEEMEEEEEMESKKEDDRLEEGYFTN